MSNVTSLSCLQTYVSECLSIPTLTNYFSLLRTPGGSQVSNTAIDRRRDNAEGEKEVERIGWFVVAGEEGRLRDDGVTRKRGKG